MDGDTRAQRGAQCNQFEQNVVVTVHTMHARKTDFQRVPPATPGRRVLTRTHPTMQRNTAHPPALERRDGDVPLQCTISFSDSIQHSAINFSVHFAHVAVFSVVRGR